MRTRSVGDNLRHLPHSDSVTICCAGGFANTDLDMQLKQRGIDHVVLVGMRANTAGSK